MKNALLIFVAPFVGFVLHANAQSPEELPAELDRVVSQHVRLRADAISKVNSAAAKSLDALKVQYMRSGNLDAANKTQAKIDELNAEILKLSSVATPPLGNPQVATYTDTHKGHAGWGEKSVQSTYHFNVTKTSGKAKIFVDAGNPGNSKGEVSLKSGNKSIVLGTWDGSKQSEWPLQFETILAKPGQYEVHFSWRSGNDGLTIRSVTIDTRGQ